MPGPLPTSDRPAPWKPAAALLAAGVALWAWVDRGDVGSPRTVWVTFLGVCVVVAVPVIRAAFASVVQSPTRPPRFRASLAVAVASAAYFATSAAWQGRDMGPHAHDDFAYLTQAKQVAGGRLWSHVDPAVADFFDSPYLIVRPVYAVQYWPGTALAYAAGAKLGWPPWWTAVVLAGATAGAFYHLLRELAFAPAAAVLGVVLLAAGRPFHTVSVTVNAHVPVLLGGLVATIAAVRWARGGHLSWVAIGGAAVRGRPYLSAWLPSLMHYLFLDEPRTQRIVGEPRADHAQQIRNLHGSGFATIATVDFPHKRAALVALAREHVVRDRLWVPGAACADAEPRPPAVPAA